MPNKTIRTCFGAVLLALALGASACTAVPTLGPTLQAATTSTAVPTEAATAAPTDTATPAPCVTVTPQAQAKPPRAMPSAQALQNALKQAGLTGGIVSANDGTKLTLGTGQAARPLAVAPDAIIIIPGQSSAQLGDIAVGDRVITRVPRGGGSKAVSFLLDIPKGYTARNVLVGAVQSSTDGSATVKTKGGPRVIATSPSTTVIGVQGQQPSVAGLADLKPGNAVLVIGQSSGGSFTAQVIIVLRRNPVNPGASKPSPTPTPTPGP